MPPTLNVSATANAHMPTTTGRPGPAASGRRGAFHGTIFGTDVTDEVGLHDWPQCYRACDCDGEDTWNEWPDRKVTHCAHGCEPEFGREADEAYEDDRNE